MNFLKTNSATAATANGGRVVVCGTVAAEAAAANEGDTMSLGGFGE